MGRKRKINQDAADIFIPDAESSLPPLMIVADGMGGHNGGEVASAIVVEAFREKYAQQKSAEDLPQFLRDCVEYAHEQVKERAANDASLDGMGSAVVAALIEKDKLHVINVGDSRAYLMWAEKTIQVSRDQSLVAEQIRAGLITPEEARHHPRRNVITMAINTNRASVIPIVTEIDFGPNDVLLLCSDGLWGLVNDAFLWAAANEFEPQDAAEKLAAFANISGGVDNISVLIARHKDRKAIKVASNDETQG